MVVEFAKLDSYRLLEETERAVCFHNLCFVLPLLECITIHLVLDWLKGPFQVASTTERSQKGQGANAGWYCVCVCVCVCVCMHVEGCEVAMSCCAQMFVY